MRAMDLSSLPRPACQGTSSGCCWRNPTVQIEDGFAGEPRYLGGALDTREPPIEHSAIQFNIRRLLGKAEMSA